MGLQSLKILSNISFSQILKVSIGPKAPPSTLWKLPPHNEEPRPSDGRIMYQNKSILSLFGVFLRREALPLLTFTCVGVELVNNVVEVAGEREGAQPHITHASILPQTPPSIQARESILWQLSQSKTVSQQNAEPLRPINLYFWFG